MPSAPVISSTLATSLRKKIGARCLSFECPSGNDDQLSELPQGRSLARAQRPSCPMDISRSLQSSGFEYHDGQRIASGSPLAEGFRPPHEIASASYMEQHSLASFGGRSSTRHKSIADRLKSVVFEQTGHDSKRTAGIFLG